MPCAVMRRNWVWWRRSGAKAGRAACEIVADATVAEAATEATRLLGRDADRLEARLAAIDQESAGATQGRSRQRRLAAIPGVGPIGAITMALTVDATHFTSGRHFAAWLGLAPREISTGGKQRLGGISRAGNERLRQLLVLGATAVIRFAKPGAPPHRHGCWHCWSVSRASSPRSLWPTRWPGLSGP